ncbi:MAG: DUF1439 domain-containing protein [Polaromonas sp.]|uniref:DUF1439 domain-containing protein n=1 Tax=Polaromonas sp. TaxID=1869339 RepID=UPI00248A3585|nr:DUF1439 domain-containing protein [Polaromonas sp.]MDI1236669.1 DUF1439 domain-containing protein [Polaromonas sp.]
MKRRLLLLTLPGWMALAAAARAAAPAAPGGTGYKVTAEQLQQAVAQRFPRRYEMGSLLNLNVQAPRVRLLPEQNRLGTEMMVDAAGPALARPSTGSFDVDFALRYEASDQTLRAHQIRLNALRLDDMAPGPAALLQAYAPTLASQAFKEVVLHRLKPQDLMLTDGLGLEPGSITVTAKGLTIALVPKKML